MTQLKELANPRGPFPSPGSLRTPGLMLGILLCLLAFALWFRGRPKAKGKPKKRSPKGEALARLLQLELQAEEDLEPHDLRLLASNLGAVLRHYYQAETQQSCLGLTQTKLLTFIREHSPQRAKVLKPLLSRWEAVIYARRSWGREERIADTHTLRNFLQDPNEAH